MKLVRWAWQSLDPAKYPVDEPTPLDGESDPFSIGELKTVDLIRSNGEMEISDNLLCLFNVEVEKRDGSYVIEVPEHEVTVGDLQSDRAYRIAMLSSAPEGGTERGSMTAPDESHARERGVPEPPVEEGDIREVEIEDMGEQGDGIARVERGYIVFVSDTDIGDRVTIEITAVRNRFAFGEVIQGRR